MSDAILAAYHGGLGDSLQFSTLPEEFYKQQNRETYIWDKATFRNSEIFDLVWGCNPYIKGVKSGEWNAGDTPEIPYSNILGNAIMNWEKFHGLEPKNKYPKIYYQPEKHKDIGDIFLVDLTSISIDYDNQNLFSSYEKIKKRFPDKKFVSVSFQKLITSGKLNTYDFNFDGYIEVENIFRYCDLLTSVYGIVALSSGASHLSSALKQYHPDLHSICIMDQMWYNHHLDRGLFLFDNIEYVIY
jgi:hypothetical protein